MSAAPEVLPPLKVLLVCESVPSIDAVTGNGSSLITYNLVMALPSRVSVRVVSFGSPDELPSALHARTDALVVLPRRPWGRRRRYLAGRWTPSAWELDTPAARDVVARWSRWADVSMFHGLDTAPLLATADGVVAFNGIDPARPQLDEAVLRLAGPKRMHAMEVRRRGLRAERVAARRSSGWAVVSESDAVLLRHELGVEVTCIPNGTDVLHPVYADVGTPPTVGFVGSLNFAPNVAAVERLVREVMPLVRGSVPLARLLVAGRKAGAGLSAELAADPGTLLVDGFEALGDVFGQTHVMCFPDLVGAGVRNSVMESFAYGQAVVGTRHALRGADAPAGSVVEDDASDIADALVLLLTDDDSLGEARARSRERATAVRSWASVAHDYESWLRCTLERSLERPS